MKCIRPHELWRKAADGLQLALFTVALLPTNSVNGAGRYAVAQGDVSAKMAYCQDCHGPSGQGYNGYYPIPRLAGQQPQYFKNQLEAFKEGRRANKIMFDIARSLNPAMTAALAANFRAFNPRPLGGGPKHLVAVGRRIFQNGDPDANVAACAACHGGPEAQGSGEIPRLAGQLYDYVVNELIDWSKERGQNPVRADTSATMSPVAHSLTRSQVEAVAAYVNYLR
jgi:cytochrome c553